MVPHGHSTLARESTAMTPTPQGGSFVSPRPHPARRAGDLRGGNVVGAAARALSMALTSANEEVSLAEARLEQARNREATARLNRLQAAASLAEVQTEIKRTEGRLAQQARDAYMTGGMADLAALVDSQDLSVLADRAITLNYVAADGADTLSRLDMARRRADVLHQQMVQ